MVLSGLRLLSSWLLVLEDVAFGERVLIGRDPDCCSLQGGTMEDENQEQGGCSHSFEPGGRVLLRPGAAEVHDKHGVRVRRRKARAVVCRAAGAQAASRSSFFVEGRVLTLEGMTTGEVVARILKSAGTRYVFGYPGGEVVALIEAFRQAGLEMILTKHEATGSFMAAAWGELTGECGVSISTLGPGATNMITGVAHAYLDRSPMLAFTGQVSSGDRGIATHQVVDAVALYRPVTKWSATITAARAGDMVSKALVLARTERPGPVHLELSGNVALEEAPWDQSFTLGVGAGGANPEGNRTGGFWSGPGAVEEARALLARSKRPVVVAGLGAVRTGAGQALLDFARRAQAPVLTTIKAKGIIPEDDPLWAGVIDMFGYRIVNKILEESDLVVAVGLDVVEFIHPWPSRAPVVYIDHLPHVDGYLRPRVELVGDPGAFLVSLSGGVSDNTAWKTGELEEVKRRVTDWINPPGRGLSVYEVAEAVRRVIPRSGVATCDVGAHKLLLGQAWKAYEPGTFLVSNGLSGMGYALPAAMAAKLVDPNRPVVAFIGDGGLGMYLGELETAVRLQLGIIVVVFVDNTLRLVQMNQQRRGYLAHGVDFGAIDFVKVAEAVGAHGTVVDSVAGCEDAVQKALGTTGPVVVAAHINPERYRG